MYQLHLWKSLQMSLLAFNCAKSPGAGWNSWVAQHISLPNLEEAMIVNLCLEKLVTDRVLKRVRTDASAGHGIWLSNWNPLHEAAILCWFPMTQATCVCSSAQAFSLGHALGDWSAFCGSHYWYFTMHYSRNKRRGPCSNIQCFSPAS